MRPSAMRAFSGLWMNELWGSGAMALSVHILIYTLTDTDVVCGIESYKGRDTLVTYDGILWKCNFLWECILALGVEWDLDMSN